MVPVAVVLVEWGSFRSVLPFAPFRTDGRSFSRRRRGCLEWVVPGCPQVWKSGGLPVFILSGRGLPRFRLSLCPVRCPRALVGSRGALSLVLRLKSRCSYGLFAGRGKFRERRCVGRGCSHNGVLETKTLHTVPVEQLALFSLCSYRAACSATDVQVMLTLRNGVNLPPIAMAVK